MGVSIAACECGGPGGCACLRHGEEAQDTAIVLPLYHQLTEEDQDRVIKTLESTIREL